MNKNSIQPILKVENLSTSFQTEEGTIHAVNGVSFDIFPNEILGIVKLPHVAPPPCVQLFLAVHKLVTFTPSKYKYI